MLGSLSIAVNSLTGPAMLSLPATFARSGVIPTCSALIFACILSSLCSTHLANTISKVEGNADFKKEVEYSDAFQIFWGRRWFVVTQVLFFFCITCLNISSIVDTSQVVDTFMAHWMYGGAAAVFINSEGPQWLRWDYDMCTEVELASGDCIPFIDEQDGVLFTAGNLVVTVVFLPMALVDLKENALWQIVGFLVLVVTSIQFVVQFSTWPGLSLENSSLWGYDWDDLFGVVLFNFALTIAIPAWLYEREPHVDVPTVIYGSSLLSTAMYIAIGLLGSLTMPNVADNMLQSMMTGTMGVSMELGASIFAFAIIGLGTPLFSVLTRLNLMGSHTCSRGTANILSVYFPFAVAWMLNDGTAITKLLSWGGIIFTSLIVFVFPLLLAIHEMQNTAAPGSIDVYCGLIKGHRAELISLWILLFLAMTSVSLAIWGNLY